MARPSQELWDETLALYEAADAEAFAAYLAADDFPHGSAEEREADQRYADLRAIADEFGERLLGYNALTAAAARYQLKVFALRNFSIDLNDGPANSKEDVDATFRRIFVGLSQAELGARA